MYNQLNFHLTRKISLLIKLDILYDCFDGSFTTIKYWSYYYYYIQSTRADIRGVHCTRPRRDGIPCGNPADTFISNSLQCLGPL